ncbi:MAG TPA: hypothetical protein GX013_04290 [Propionibacterium sp.]|nr:hypothetical protein [Propionibacterium sp.]
MDRELFEVEERIFALLVIRLDGLIQRRTPVRNVSAGPVQGIARLRFSDGATILVRSHKPGTSAAVVSAILRGRSVLLESWDWHEDGLMLTLSIPGAVRRRTSLHRVILLGADQPD